MIGLTGHVIMSRLRPVLSPVFRRGLSFSLCREECALWEEVIVVRV